MCNSDYKGGCPAGCLKMSGGGGGLETLVAELRGKAVRVLWAGRKPHHGDPG